MADITNNNWAEADSDNTQPSPLGLPPGILPSELGGAVRAVMGAVKRSHSRINAMVSSTGSANAYALTYSVGPTVYVKGEVYRFFANHTNTGAATLNINALGTRSLFRADGSAVAPGEIVSGQVVSVVCDGVNFLAQSIRAKEFKANVAIAVNGEAAVSVEDTGAPATTYRVKKLVSTRNANGGNDLVLRQQRPSDGAVEDFVLKTGTAGSIWTTGNFTPALKADLVGASFTGTVSVKGAAGVGAASLITGGADRTGYIEFRDKDGLRHAYIGNSNGTNIDLTAERGDFNFSGGTPRIAGNAIWHTGSFNPDLKANLTGAGFTGTITGTAATFSGAGSFGSLIVSARPTFNGATPWDTANFDPASKASLNAYGVFTGLGFTGGETYLYKDSGTNNLVVRTGASNAYRYSTFGQDGVFTSSGGIRANGDLVATNRVVVGEGQPYSYIEMRDTDHGTRFIHNNDNSIGFLNKSGSWAFQSKDDGNIWTPLFGYLNDYVIGQANRGRDEANTSTSNNYVNKNTANRQDMKGDILLVKGEPRLKFDWPGIGGHSILSNSDNRLYVQKESGYNYTANLMSIGPSGDVWTAQLGDLNTRIEDRANAWQNTARQYSDNKLETIRSTYHVRSADLEIGNTATPAIWLHWGGVKRAALRLANNSELQWMDQGGQVHLAVRNNGSIWTQEFGDLNGRIENRINNKSARLAFAGDVGVGANQNGAMYEPYGGSVITGRQTVYVNAGYTLVSNFRHRYLQMSNSNGDWYTCGYV